MRYTETIEVCDICGKRFYGIPVNIHGSYEYIHHTNFSDNIRCMFYRTKDIQRNKRILAIVDDFFIDDVNGGKQIPKEDAIEFLECFKHYLYPDKEFLYEVFQEIQNRINKMEE